MFSLRELSWNSLSRTFPSGFPWFLPHFPATSKSFASGKSFSLPKLVWTKNFTWSVVSKFVSRGKLFLPQCGKGWRLLGRISSWTVCWMHFGTGIYRLVFIVAETIFLRSRTGNLSLEISAIWLMIKVYEESEIKAEAEEWNFWLLSVQRQSLLVSRTAWPEP